MNLTFCKLESNRNELNKTYHPILVTDVNLKKDFDFNNPELIFNNGIAIQIFSDINYLHITEFDRYYFVENIIFSKSVVYIKLQCDVLETYKTLLLDSKVHIVKSDEMNLYSDGNIHKDIRKESKIYKSGVKLTDKSKLLVVLNGGTN